ncbi:MAG: hypothetical protein K2L05_08835, partial [Muribaculaceae bacterium]|nr:hypothetical protein [Muribaculaceae bacterium]
GLLQALVESFLFLFAGKDFVKNTHKIALYMPAKLRIIFETLRFVGAKFDIIQYSECSEFSE